jgi:DNA-binding response OmpR family regulator
MDSTLNILVVEDHDDLRDATVAALAFLGHVVRGVSSGEALDDELGGFRPDVLVLDLNLPGEDGLSIARRLRQAEPHVGIIMVTARDQVRDVTRGYGSGADIYLTKPTSSEVLGAAVQALARRVSPTGNAASVSVNPNTLQLTGPAAVANLSDHECSLLIALATAHDRRMETWQLMEMGGRHTADFNKTALEAQLVRLRKKLEQVGASTPVIKAIRGHGYQLCIAIEVRK